MDNKDHKINDGYKYVGESWNMSPKSLITLDGIEVIRNDLGEIIYVKNHVTGEMVKKEKSNKENFSSIEKIWKRRLLMDDKRYCANCKNLGIPKKCNECLDNYEGTGIYLSKYEEGCSLHKNFNDLSILVKEVIELYEDGKLYKKQILEIEKIINTLELIKNFFK